MGWSEEATLTGTGGRGDRKREDPSSACIPHSAEAGWRASVERSWVRGDVYVRFWGKGLGGAHPG